MKAKIGMFFFSQYGILLVLLIQGYFPTKNDIKTKCPFRKEMNQSHIMGH